jgi:probable phosphoglycerate mutase
MPSTPAHTHHPAHGSGHEIRRVVLWRHGRTEWNDQKRFQGHLNVPLDEVGRQQAATAAEALAVLRPARIVTSDLSRAAQTAAALAAVTGVAVREDAGLREAHAGEWQGRTHAQIRADDADRLRQWRSSVDVRPGGSGETRIEVGSRMAATITRNLSGLPVDELAVFVTHGGSARAAVGSLLGLDPLHWHQLGIMRNCAWAVLEVDPLGSWHLDAYNRGAMPEFDDPAAAVRDAIV